MERERISRWCAALALAVWLSFGLSGLANGGWRVRSRMPVPRYGMCAVVLDDAIYLIGGRTEHGEMLHRVDRYFPTTDTWDSSAQPVMRARSYGGAAVVGGKIFFFGGRTKEHEVTAKVEIYDPVANRWSEAEEMHEAREAFGVAVLDGRIYVFGGTDEHGRYEDDVEVFDPSTGEWSELERSLSFPRAAPATTVVGDLIVAIGGLYGGPLKLVEQYDAQFRSTSLPDLGEARAGAAAVTLGDTVFVTGGLGSNGEVLASTEFYVGKDGIWRTGEPMNQARQGHAAVAFKGKVYVFGGQTGGISGRVLDSVEEYTHTASAVRGEPEPHTPVELELSPAYPNPFNSSTTIVLRVPTGLGGQHAVLEIRNVRARTVRVLHSGSLSAGTHRVIWDGRSDWGTDCPTGVYLIVLKMGRWTQTRKLMLIR